MLLRRPHWGNRVVRGEVAKSVCGMDDRRPGSGAERKGQRSPA